MTRRWHLRLSADSQWHMPQKIHRGQVPRVGGLAIVGGFVAALVHASVPSGDAAPPISSATVSLLVLGLIPVFAVGLIEDITKRIGARLRLLWIALGAVTLIQFRHLLLPGIDAPILDPLFAHSGFALAFSVFACVGAANAYNIVDGLNGLLAGVSLVTLAAIAYVAMSVGDAKVLALACLLAGAVAGWMPFNWPRARLFAGDGGAYSIGFVIAALLLLLAARHRDGVSPWFGLTAAALPVWETVYSIWRRLRRGEGPMQPDQAHLHQLVRLGLHRVRLGRAMQYARRMASGPHAGDARRRLARIEPPNAGASPFLWLLHACAAGLGALAHRETLLQIAIFCGFATVYVLLHGWLLRGRDTAAAAVAASPIPASAHAGPDRLHGRARAGGTAALPAPVGRDAAAEREPA
ncbi:MAG: MraY family glycosyltransferase [Burkholderiales bacterium]